VQVAGGLLCPPGGYPSRAGWAPDDASVVVADAADAERAVVRMRDLGASVVKLTLNSDVGPVLDDDVLRAIAVAADRVGLLTVAHVQGPGQVRRALDAGLLRFAHAPFSELLPDDLLDRAADGTWISTLDIHRGDEAQEVAIANLRGFRERGGHVLYGTDLGNGDLPVGVNEHELRALQRVGLGREALLTALGSDDSLDAGQDGAHWTPRASWVPKPPPADERDDPAWLARASVLTASTLQELLP
jgi:imidazolonepropionase-like amidohydrolase